MTTKEPLILWFEKLGIGDVPSVGGKNASLGEMYCNLKSKGISVPNGFATTAAAYRYFYLKRASISKFGRFSKTWILRIFLIFNSMV